MGSLRLTLAILAAAVCLNAAQDVEVVAATCADARNCGECLQSGCAWQPGADGTSTSCFGDCQMDEVEALVRRCYIGSAKTCPKSEDVCAELTSCEDCTAHGCRFTEGACQPECNYADEGDILGECARAASDCGVPNVMPRFATVPMVEITGCAEHAGDCSSCLAEGCVYVPANGGTCKEQCAFEDDNCIADSACPNSILKNTRSEPLPTELPTLPELPVAEEAEEAEETEEAEEGEVAEKPLPDEPLPVAALSADSVDSPDSAAGSTVPWVLLVQLCAALVALHGLAN